MSFAFTSRFGRILPLRGSPLRGSSLRGSSLRDSPRGGIPRADAPSRRAPHDARSVFEETCDHIEAIFSCTLEAIVELDASARILMCNTSACDILGYSEQEMLGKAGHDLLRPGLNEHHAFTRDDCPFCKAFQGGHQLLFNDFVIHNRAGDNVRISGSFSPLHLAGQGRGGVLVFHCLGAASEMEFLEKIVFSSAQEPFCLWKEDMTILCNEATARFFGAPDRETVSNDFWRFSPTFQEDGSHSREAAQVLFLECRVKGFIQANWLHQHADGTLLPCLITISRINHNQYEGYFCSIKDMRPQLELVRAKALAEEASRAKSDFLAHMSHEIRTPMNAILGLSYLCLQHGADDRQKTYLLKIQSAGKALLGIINNILDVSKIEAGKMVLENAPFRLSEVVENLSNLSASLSSGKDVEVLFDVDPALPDVFEGDATRLGQVLTNLLGNALKFTEKGQVVLRIYESARQGQRHTLRVDVADSGIGMTAEQAAHIFKPFEQADVSTTRKYGGTGLGLAISRHFVQMMGGDLTVESEPGLGSTFSFSITLSVASEGDTWQDPALAEGARLLVADDNPAARLIFEQILTRYGFHVTTAINGEDACAKIVAADEAGQPFDMALLDWRMPGLDGNACAKRLHSLPLSHRPRLLMTSAYGQDNAMDAANGLFQGFVPKPVSPQVLWRTVLRGLGRGGRLPHAEDARKVDRDLRLRALRGASILLVEDNETNQEVATQLLQRLGLRVTVAGNGQEAVTICENQRFDLIFMDIQMPVMDGFTATALLRARPGNGPAELPIIAMTAHAMVEHRAQSLEAGMNEHITKPIDPDALAETLLTWLRPRDNQPPVDADAPSPAPGTASDGVPLSVEGLNWQIGLHHVGGDDAAFRQHLARFPTRYGGSGARLAAAVAAGQWNDASREAHTLKGVAATLGMAELSATAARLEASCREERLDEADLHELTSQLAALAAALTAAFAPVAETSPAGGTPADGPGVPGSPDRHSARQVVREALERLTGLMDDDIMACMAIIQSLERHVPALLLRERHAALRDAAYDLDREALAAATAQALADLTEGSPS